MANGAPNMAGIGRNAEVGLAAEKEEAIRFFGRETTDTVDRDAAVRLVNDRDMEVLKDVRMSGRG